MTHTLVAAKSGCYCCGKARGARAFGIYQRMAQRIIAEFTGKMGDMDVFTKILPKKSVHHRSRFCQVQPHSTMTP